MSNPTKAVIKLNLLRLTRVVCDNQAEAKILLARFNIPDMVLQLAKQDEAILVRQLAKEIYPSLLPKGETKVPEPIAKTAVEATTTSNASAIDRLKKRISWGASKLATAQDHEHTRSSSLVDPGNQTASSSGDGPPHLKRQSMISNPKTARSQQDDSVFKIPFLPSPADRQRAKPKRMLSRSHK
jgi:hypothetical protein